MAQPGRLGDGGSAEETNSRWMPGTVLCSR